MFLLPIETENPTRHRPYVVFSLLAMTAIVAVWPLISGVEETFRQYGYVAANPRPVALLTSMFLHGSLWHLLGNLFFLFMFGDNVEDVVGPLVFLAVYLISGIGATLTHVALTSTPDAPLIGASGAISGIVGMYLVFFPRAPFELHLVVIRWSVKNWKVSAFVATGVWFATQLVLGLVMSASGLDEVIGIAFWAHVGGFLIGALIGYALLRLGCMQRYNAQSRRIWLLGYVA